MKLLSCGEVLWDLIEGKAYIGGAPFNLAAHAARLGVEAWLVSAVGDDPLGRRALEQMNRLGVNSELVRVADQPTGVVDVEVDAEGKPTFRIRQPAAWDFIRLAEEDISRAGGERFDALCYGSLCQRHAVSRRALRSLVEGVRGNGRPWRFCDINLRPPFVEVETVRWSVASADVLKLNDDEVKACCGLFGRRYRGMEDFCRWAGGEFGLEAICVTLGAEGCLVYGEGSLHRCEGISVKVADTVGAGDAFSAAFLMRYLGGGSPEEAGGFASRVGALVASRAGAVPDYTLDELEC